MSDDKYLSSLVERFDKAISQLSEVSMHMDKMLAMHEIRLENQEKQTEVIHIRINDFKKEVVDEMRSLRDENKIQHKETNERLSRLEKWRWSVVGAATVLGFIFAQIEFISKFFN
jgi:hypothetical protein